jgi:outer membrane protein assembly factor BamE (lipoprotein component of BamABCDE complex)
MSKLFSIVSFLFFTACASGGSLMTSDAFHDIPIGATKQEVIKNNGRPVVIHEKEDGTEELDYVERLRIGARTVLETHYILTIKEGKVTSKRIENSTPPPTNFDSYEMQTTQQLP